MSEWSITRPQIQPAEVLCCLRSKCFSRLMSVDSVQVVPAKGNAAGKQMVSETQIIWWILETTCLILYAASEIKKSSLCRNESWDYWLPYRPGQSETLDQYDDCHVQILSERRRIYWERRSRCVKKETCKRQNMSDLCESEQREEICYAISDHDVAQVNIVVPAMPDSEPHNPIGLTCELQHHHSPE